MDTHESDDATLARMAFARALRFELEVAGLTLRDLSRLTRREGAKGIGETTLGHYVRAERSPRWPEQVQIADALDIDVVDLITTAVTMYNRLQEDRTPAEITPEPASGDLTH